MIIKRRQEKGEMIKNKSKQIAISGDIKWNSPNTNEKAETTQEESKSKSQL
jgi:hypothetical protein